MVESQDFSLDIAGVFSYSTSTIVLDLGLVAETEISLIRPSHDEILMKRGTGVQYHISVG